MMLDKSEGKYQANIQNSVRILTLWKNYNINHVPWNCILSTKKLLQTKKGNKMSQNVIQIIASVGNKNLSKKMIESS